MPLAAIAAGFSIGSSILSAFGGFDAARGQRRNAARMARDVLDQGEEDVTSYRQKLAQVMGRQAVGGAAQGIDLSDGTAKIITDQTREIGAIDVGRIRRNAQRQAWSIRKTGAINAAISSNNAWGDVFRGAGTLIGMMQDPWDRHQGRQRAAVTNVIAADPAWG